MFVVECLGLVFETEFDSESSREIHAGVSGGGVFELVSDFIGDVLVSDPPSIVDF